MEPVAVYKALADDSRLRLVHLLALGSLNVQELTSILGLSQPTVSHHLKVLQNAGLISAKKEGTWSYYTLIAEGTGRDLMRPLIDQFGNGLGAQPALQADRSKLQEINSARRDRARRYFDSVAPEWKALREEITGEDTYLDLVAKEIPAQSRFLDLGCGSGALLEHILPRKGKTIGVDYSQAMLEQAKTNLGSQSAQVDLRLGYLEHLPIGDGEIDVAAAYMVMHHLSDPREALRDIRRVLAKKGKFVVFDLTKHSNELMRERHADLWLGFDSAEFSRWLRSAGFESTTKILGNDKQFFLTVATIKE